MAGGIDTACLYSTVQNTSGGRKKFGFLPPHGRELTANEEFTIFGDVLQSIIRFERTEARRSIIAFEHAIQRGDITILHTPNPIMQDDATGQTKMIRSHNGVLGLVDPCWKGSFSNPPIG